MKKNPEIKPKDKDILVLKKERNIIYEYNANNRQKSYNAYNVAVYPSLDRVAYKLNNNDVVAYNAEWDFATEEEIKLFHDLIRKNEIQCRKEYAEEIAYQIIDHYCFDVTPQYSPEYYTETAESIKEKIYAIINENFRM